MNDRYSKLAFLHRVKERKTPSLSARASFAPFSLKVAWSGKSQNHSSFRVVVQENEPICQDRLRGQLLSAVYAQWDFMK